MEKLDCQEGLKEIANSSLDKGSVAYYVTHSREPIRKLPKCAGMTWLDLEELT